MNTTVGATTATTHVKVNYNNEFRRFALETLSFAQLESTLRVLYSLDDSVQLKVKFQDDENDWVLLSSDEELSYAVEFGLPLRLSFQVIEVQTPPPTSNIPSSAEIPTVFPAAKMSDVYSSPATSFYPPAGESTVPVRGGRGRGRGRVGGNVTMQDRLNAKTSRLSERIEALEARLAENPTLPSERQRVLRWRLSQLQSKLSAVQEKKSSLDMSVSSSNATATTPNLNTVPTPSVDTADNATEELRGFGFARRGHGPHGHGPHGHEHSPGPHGHGRGRGRGGFRGPRGGRGALKFVSESNHPDIVNARDAFTKFRQCKIDLKVARKSGNPQAIESCEAAFKAAQNNRKESLGNILGDQRAHKRECAQNLRFAQKSGNEEQIKTCEAALAQAITELKQAKADILNF